MTVYDLVFVKPFVIMLLHQLQNRMLYICCLYQHFTLLMLSACPSTHLFHKLKRTFIHPEIGKAHQAIRIQNTYQTYVIKIQTLYHHLCAYKQIKFMVFKLLY